MTKKYRHPALNPAILLGNATKQGQPVQPVQPIVSESMDNTKPNDMFDKAEPTTNKPPNSDSDRDFPTVLTQKEITAFMQQHKITHPLKTLLLISKHDALSIPDRIGLCIKLLEYTQPKFTFEPSPINDKADDDSEYQQEVNQAKIVDMLYTIFPDGKLPTRE